jgi:hypothetical protein
MIYFWPTARALQKTVDVEYPTEAIPYLQAHPPAGPMLNFYLWGGYLGWRDNNLKVFVDSRVDIFEYAGVLKDYLDVLQAQKAAPILEKYKIQYVLFPKNEPLTFMLEHDPQWTVRYSDLLTVLLERTDKKNIAAAEGGGK